MVLLALFIDSSVQWVAGDGHPWAKGVRAHATGSAIPVYASIASQHIYITNLAFIHHLATRKSTIYHPRLARTITCFVDLEKDSTERVLAYLFKLPNTLGFKYLFPFVPYISFVLSWIGSGRNPSCLNVCDRPIHIQARFDRYIGGARVDVHITMIDSDPSWDSHPRTWLEMLETLREVRVIGPGRVKWFLCDYPHDEPDDYQSRAPDGVRHFRQTTAMRQRQGDVKGINWHLWKASYGHSDSGWLTTLLAWLEFGRRSART
ncbi:hypothetical protein IW262DRAFT_1467404 [Armillaria fumosa]|nr:hypothetical protein IW262DRAFT_1467404 [Armillaria fumosa]